MMVLVLLIHDEHDYVHLDVETVIPPASEKIAFTWKSHSGYFLYFEHRYMTFFPASISSVRLIDTYSILYNIRLKFIFIEKFVDKIPLSFGHSEMYKKFNKKRVINSKNTESTDYESCVSILLVKFIM